MKKFKENFTFIILCILFTTIIAIFSRVKFQETTERVYKPYKKQIAIQKEKPLPLTDKKEDSKNKQMENE